MEIIYFSGWLLAPEAVYRDSSTSSVKVWVSRANVLSKRLQDRLDFTSSLNSLNLSIIFPFGCKTAARLGVDPGHLNIYPVQNFIHLLGDLLQCLSPVADRCLLRHG